MTQLEAKSDPQSPPAAKEGSKAIVHTAPTDAVPPPIHSLNPATRLKHKLRDTKDLIVCPGVYDGLSARVAQSVGFETLYMVRQRHVYSLTTHPSANPVLDRSRYNSFFVGNARPWHCLA